MNNHWWQNILNARNLDEFLRISSTNHLMRTWGCNAVSKPMGLGLFKWGTSTATSRSHCLLIPTIHQRFIDIHQGYWWDIDEKYRWILVYWWDIMSEMNLLRFQHHLTSELKTYLPVIFHEIFTSDIQQLIQQSDHWPGWLWRWGARHLGSREVGEVGRSWHRFLGQSELSAFGFRIDGNLC